MLPLPTSGRHRFPYWHTVGFLLGWDRAYRTTKELLRTHDAFYYLIHPADFADKLDLTSKYQNSLVRLNIYKDEKIFIFLEVLKMMEASSRSFSTMSELSDYVSNRLNRDTG